MRRLKVLQLCALVTLGLAPFVPAGTPPAAAGEYFCFPETKYCSDNAFLEYWRGHGAVEILGLPVSQPFRDDRGLIVQVYERAIMEWHPDNPPEYQVLLTRLGDTQLGARPQRDDPPQPCDPADCAFLADTNHTLRGIFLNYWQTYGGLPVFGFPLTEEFDEVNPSDGKVYRVQYFERNRFEYHPEYAGSRFEVSLGLLGAEALSAQPAVLGRPAETVPDYSRPVAAPVAAEAPVRLAIPSLGVDAAVERVGLDAAGNMASPADYDNTAWYEPGPRPGQRGNAVIAGHIDSAELGRRVVFGNLDQIAVGAEVWVTGEGGRQLRFIVQSVEIYPTENSPRERIFGPTSDANLNLISCIGDFDPGNRSYNQRIVVYTRLDGTP